MPAGKQESEGTMKAEDLTDFDKLAGQWDQNPVPVRIAGAVAEAIIRELGPGPDRDVLDFGCGTGLVTLKLQPLARTITGADSSQGMLDKLREKSGQQGLSNVAVQLVDFASGGRVWGTFDLVVSSMTLHHVPDPAALLEHWFALVRPGGRIGFADLDTEDGSFHADNTGVFHKGFDREYLKQLLQRIGFRDIRDSTATTVTREIEGNGTREFSVFLITAGK
jgi:2-polyprenyl-3-methyl-5-hydroxy-6-metoxy-1,4-benzoquinol methylase